MTTLEQSKPADEARDSVPRSGAVSSCNDLLSVRLTHLDLFSGIGGFALAAQAAGFQTIAFSEIEPYACKVLKRHWPNVPILGDIRNVRGIRADLVTGGFPCQPYSLAGKRTGAGDDRALWPEMLRVIAESECACVLGENVAGIITMELDRVLADLESLGYAAWPLVIPACAVDARHRRDRVWIVAYSEGNDRRRRLRKTGTEQDRNLAANGSAPLADADKTGWREQRRAEPVGTQHAAAECGGQNVGDTNGERRNGQHLSIQPGRPLEAGAETAGSGEDVPNADGREHESGGAQSNQRPIPRPDESGWCGWPTEPAVGRVAHGIPNRAHRLRALGNAIVPQVAETLIREMARTLNDEVRHSAGKTECDRKGKDQ